MKFNPEGQARLKDVINTLNLLYDAGMITETELTQLADEWALEIVERYIEVQEL